MTGCHHGAGARCLALLALGLRDARDAEVGELGVTRRVDQHVCGLDVAMDHARLVREVERIEQLPPSA